MKSYLLVCRINPLCDKEKYWEFFRSSNADGCCALDIEIWVVKFPRGGYKITPSPPALRGFHYQGFSHCYFTRLNLRKMGPF